MTVNLYFQLYNCYIFKNINCTQFLPLFYLQLKVPTSDKPGVFVNFRKLLLNRCQKEFEKDQDDDEIFEKKQKELEAAKDVRNVIFYTHCPYIIFLFQLNSECYPSTKPKHQLVSVHRRRNVSA